MSEIQNAVKSRDYNLYLSMFNIPQSTSYTIEELEKKRYQLLQKEEESQLIDKAFEVLLRLRLYDLKNIDKDISVTDYKNAFLKEYKEKFMKQFPHFSDNEKLNDDISRLHKYIDDSYNNISNANSFDNLKDNIRLFYSNYHKLLTIFVSHYLDELKKKNSKKDIRFFTTIEVEAQDYILDYNLKDLLETINNKILELFNKQNFKNKIIKALDNYFIDKEDSLKNVDICELLSKYYGKIDDFLKNLWDLYMQSIDAISTSENIDNIITAFTDDFKMKCLEFESILKEDIRNDLRNREKDLVMANIIAPKEYVTNLANIATSTSYEELLSISNGINNNKSSKFAK
ncbi:MAG: hypothetical protein IJ572_00710 [Bacilli bacterium]|nr:hypothetical protein [Bacilli bacterium]